MRKRIISIAAVASIIAAFSAGGRAASSGPRSWAGLDRGPHAVGFRSIERYDQSRIFREKYGPGGMLRPGERSRPVLIYLWYPAEAAQNAPRMVYGEYSFANPADPALFPLVSRIQEREIYTVVYPFFRGQRGSVIDFMNVEMEAVREAKPAAGTFPAIVYHTDIHGSAGENALLCEYLASHGYVVASVQPIGAMLSYADASTDDLEHLVRDKEYVIAELRAWPQTDGAKLALVGNSFGALTALVLAMRNSDIDAVVTFGEWLSPPGWAELVAEYRGFRPERMKTPVLSVFETEQEESVRAAIDSLAYATRILVTMTGGYGRAFSHHAALAAAMPGAAPGGSDSTYATLCSLVRQFFDGQLKGRIEGLGGLQDAAAGASLAGVAKVRTERGTPAPLREEEIIAVFWEEGVAAGAALLDRLRSEGAAEPLPPGTLNTLGYQFLAAQRLEEALEIFRTGSELFPGSANAWASLGEACMYADRAQEARTCYQKTLELLSIDTALDDQAREALKTQAEAMLKRLGG